MFFSELWDLIKKLVHIAGLALTAFIVGAIVLVLSKGIDFTERTWDTITSPLTGIFGPRSPEHDLKKPAGAQLAEMDKLALATMIAFDSRGELAQYRPEVMRQMALVALRIRVLEKKEQPDAPERSISSILAGANTWLPENYDPQENSYCPWYDRDPERMRSRLYANELVDARKIVDAVIKANPGEGPIRYTRPEPPTYTQQAVRLCSNESGAAEKIKQTMDLDTGLKKPGMKTHFYRRRSKAS